MADPTTLHVQTTEHYKALGHPLRHRLLFALGSGQASAAQLASRLQVAKGTVIYHLGVLRAAGLVEIAATQQVRGGTERIFRRSAERLQFSGPGAVANTAVMLQAVVDEMGAEEPVLLALRNVRLTTEQAATLAERIGDLIVGLTDAGDQEARYGVLTGVYRAEQPAGRRAEPASG